VGHGAGPALLHRQAGLGAVERLDLRLLVDREDDGVRRRIDIEPDNITQFCHELGIVGELEMAHAVRGESVGSPDALNRRHADTDGLRHGGGGPVGRLLGRIARGEGDDPVDDGLAERRHPRGARLVAQQALDTFSGEALLPAPHTGLRGARPAHDLDRADTFGGQEDDFGPPDMLLRGVAVGHDRLQSAAIGGIERDGDPRAHASESHATDPAGIPPRIHPSDLIH
jgi:hypothetical protein